MSKMQRDHDDDMYASLRESARRKGILAKKKRVTTKGGPLRVAHTDLAYTSDLPNLPPMTASQRDMGR